MELARGARKIGCIKCGTNIPQKEVIRMRMIDADALKDNMFGYAPPEMTWDRGDIEHKIDEMPTVCVPQDIPLRCRTCSFFADAGGGLTSMTGVGVCEMFGGTRTKDDYCSKGAWISNATN
jgi:hypothetical protein